MNTEGDSETVFFCWQDRTDEKIQWYILTIGHQEQYSFPLFEQGTAEKITTSNSNYIRTPETVQDRKAKKLRIVRTVTICRALKT